MEGVEIVNAGGAVADLFGVQIDGFGRIADGLVPAVGQCCRLGALGVGPACPLAPSEVVTGVRAGELLRISDADGRVLDSLLVPR